MYAQLLVQQTENAKELMDWLFNKNAYIYVCAATSMGADVLGAFVKIIEEYKGISHDEETSIVKGLQGKGRYVRELWTA